MYLFAVHSWLIKTKIRSIDDISLYINRGRGFANWARFTLIRSGSRRVVV